MNGRCFGRGSAYFGDHPESRQAISKWECDNGYPETEKIVRMSKLFNVSLDYILNEEDMRKPELNPDEKGIYVSREMAEGFLSYQKRKMFKKAWCCLWRLLF